jgi:hypothetical protein
MKKSCTLPNKDYSADNKQGERKIIARVDRCLNPSHEAWPGQYYDTFSGLNIVKCECSCHTR